MASTLTIVINVGTVPASTIKNEAARRIAEDTRKAVFRTQAGVVADSDVTISSFTIA